MKNVVKKAAYTLAKEPARTPVPGNKVIEEFIGQSVFLHLQMKP